MSIFIILGKVLVKKIQPFMLWESNSCHCLAAYCYPTYRGGVLTVRTLSVLSIISVRGMESI